MSDKASVCASNGENINDFDSFPMNNLFKRVFFFFPRTAILDLLRQVHYDAINNCRGL